ncbi:hypothetical protein L210DRAFT_987367 [Boletus edulis BED1]|uniref:Uncharacterized protein n=1 Tax=Boletus edulis BED1 TaxID=1328754 RepID=A0AAD4BJJ3_BOLED|nr:hypothetical protein L210DRAFT_987367 [Boletus edulis BED1]
MAHSTLLTTPLSHRRAWWLVRRASAPSTSALAPMAHPRPSNPSRGIDEPDDSFVAPPLLLDPSRAIDDSKYSFDSPAHSLDPCRHINKPNSSFDAFPPHSDPFRAVDEPDLPVGRTHTPLLSRQQRNLVFPEALVHAPDPDLLQ